MTLGALALVLAAAVCHASWNLLAKRAGGGATFVWLFGVCSAVLYAPLAVALLVVQQPRLGLLELGFMVGSALLHLTYFLLLQQGYKVGDLSLVYPLARGTGPLLSTTAAILVLGERPGPLAVAGAVLIAASIFAFTGGPSRTSGPRLRRAVVYGLLTGLLIAIYTLWDKRAVSDLLIPPVLLDSGANLGRVLMLTPLAVARWPAVRAEWRAHRLAVLGIGLLAPLSYILVLTAMTFTPVSYIAPAREISILIGALLGVRLLAEGHVRRRLIAASGMVLGVIGLALG